MGIEAYRRLKEDTRRAEGEKRTKEMRMEAGSKQGC